MKLKTLLSVPKILPALMAAITAALITQPMRASGDTIVFTENSSTSLSATINGSPLTVLNTSPDHWTITLPGTITSEANNNTGWSEPGSPNQINYLTGGFAGVPNNELFIASDFTPTAPVDLFQDGATSGGIAQDFPNLTFFVGMFTDRAAASEAPDTGTTCSLLGFR